MVEPGDDVGAAAGWGRSDDLLRGSGRSGLVARLERWVADARVDEAALRRSRERWLREVADQEATLVGTLLDLADRRAVVTVRTGSGRTHHGCIEALGVDFVSLRPAIGAAVVIALRSVTLVRTTADSAPAGSDRAVRTDLRLAELLRELAGDRERVLLVLGRSRTARRSAPRRRRGRPHGADGRRSLVDRVRGPRRRGRGDPRLTGYLPLAAGSG